MSEPQVNDDSDQAETSAVAAWIDTLRPALIARHGPQLGVEMLSEVSEYAWAERDRLARMGNPVGYLFRVSQSKVRRHRRWSRAVELPPELAGRPADEHPLEPELHSALANLGPDDRTIVVLTHSYGYRYDEVASLLDKTPAAIRNRLHRSMVRLRRELEEETDRVHG